MMLSLFGCAHGGIPIGKGVSEVEVDRADFIHGKDEVENNLIVIYNDNIDAFITEYNAEQKDDSALVADDYKVYYDVNKGIYYVKSSKTNLTVRTGSDGEVVMATSNGNDDVVHQMTVSMTVLDTLCKRGVVPDEQLAHIYSIYARVESMTGEIQSKIAEFNSKLKNLDTELEVPELLELPPMPTPDYNNLWGAQGPPK